MSGPKTPIKMLHDRIMVELDDDAGRLEDVVGAWGAGVEVDEVPLHAGGLAADDRLGVRSVDELVDGVRQPLPGRFDLLLEGRLVGHAGRLPTRRGSKPKGSSSR